MKHCILAKFKAEITPEEKASMLPEIQTLFEKALSIPGIHKVEILKNCVPRDNRYDLMIVLSMDPEALTAYDGCPSHKEWKTNYCPLLESKAIFDYEDNP